MSYEQVTHLLSLESPNLVCNLLVKQELDEKTTLRVISTTSERTRTGLKLLEQFNRDKDPKKKQTQREYKIRKEFTDY